MEAIIELGQIKIVIDDFRISHIFDIEEPIPEHELAAELTKRGYKVINDRVITHPPIRAVLLNLATINHVNISYQKESIPSYIGTSGKDKREVLKQFDILSSILMNIDPTVPSRYTAIEAVLSAKVFGKELPANSLPKFGAKDVSKFNSLFDRPFTTRSFTFHSADKTSESFYSLFFAPLNRSPRYYYVQLVIRDKDLKKVQNLSDKGEETIKDAIGLLEED